MIQADNFKCPVLVTGEWVRLDEQELQIASQLLQTNRSRWWNPSYLEPIRRGRALQLPFYGDDWNLIEVEARTVDGYGACAFIIGDGRFVPVTGSSPAIHDLNERLSPRLDADSVHQSAYLKFFTGVVWGASGPFNIVETAGEAATLLLSTEALKVEPLRSEPAEHGLTWHANVIYGSQLSNAAFRIDASGKVEMLEDHELVTGQSRVAIRPPLRVVPFRNPGAIE
ncbi:hypothetical protein [Bosea sp. BH3]|uniref:hypothetical protein n=1 Tax=Bosea sp. BH3 TaxID=2871701 RepID=UPI0021CB28A5|nr:hypothetical protein [Bosea sp. BH3]MCU4180415.1 hypothetical protein [Bosea sp. BH3]